MVDIFAILSQTPLKPIMKNQLPVCSFRCQDLLRETVWTNDVKSFNRIVDHIVQNALTVDTIDLGEKIAHCPLSDKPQWLEKLRLLQNHPFSHTVLKTAAANAQRNHDIPTLLFVFNELHKNHGLQRKSVLLEIFPVVHYVQQVVCSPVTFEIEQTLPKMLEVCSPTQCRFVVLNCLKDENFAHIESFAAQIDLDQLAQDVQIHYNNGDKGFEAAVAYFQHRRLRLAVESLPEHSLSPIKRKI